MYLLLLPGAISRQYKGQACHEVGVEHPAPVRVHLDRVDDMLQVDLVEAEDKVPHDHEGVAFHVEVRVRDRVADRASQQAAQRKPGSSGGELAAQEHVVGQGDDHWGTAAEDDEGLHIGILYYLEEEGQKMTMCLESAVTGTCSVFMFRKIVLTKIIATGANAVSFDEVKASHLMIL